MRHVFSGSFCTQISMATVIWPYDVTQSDFWFRSGQGQVKVVSNFSNQYFYTKSTCFLWEFRQDSKYVISFLVRCVDFGKSQVKNCFFNFSLYITNTFFIRKLVLFVVNVFWSRVTTKQFKHLCPIKTSRMIYNLTQFRRLWHWPKVKLALT